MSAYMAENPFTPSFGEVPTHFAGCGEIISSITRAYASERRRPELTSLFSGARGTGKTALLSLLSAKAEGMGWISVNTTARPGMLDDLEIGIHKRAEHLLVKDKSRSISGVEIAHIGGVTFEESGVVLSNWRSRVGDMLDQLAATETGLLIAVDEIDPSLEEMVELAVVYQHFVREGRKVALHMAGLPNNVSALLADKTVSFLRRAQTFRLGRIPDYEVEDALVKTIDEAGRHVDEKGVKLAVSSIGGFPFLLQLAGFRSWDAAEERDEIGFEDFARGVELARQEMDDRILESIYRELSDEEIRFLKEMLVDEGDTRISDMVERLGRSSAQVAQYRKRLMDAGIIGARRRGVIGFDLPYFKEFLLERL